MKKPKRLVDSFKVIKRRDLKTQYLSSKREKIKIDKTKLSKTKRRKIYKLAIALILIIIVAQTIVFSQSKYFEAIKLALSVRNKTFLIGFQNSGELRPTGGFWGSFAILKTASNLSKSELLFETNPYKQDNVLLNESKVELPTPMAQTWENRPQTFVNANWSFNYAEAAKTLEWYFAQGWNQKVDGVFAVSSLCVIDLLKLTGPVELPDKTEITSDNFTETMSKKIDEEYWLDEKNHEINEPKTLIKDLAPQLIEKTGRLSKLKIASFAIDQIKKGHVLLFFNDEKDQKISRNLDISGEVSPCASDCLSVVNANLNGGKTSLNVEQSITYDVKKEDGQIISNLEISRIHKTDKWPQILNRNWTRVVVPLGSQLDNVYLDGASIKDQVEVKDEEGRTSFGFWFSTDPGQEKTATLQYTLPSKSYNNYFLIYQKQPGTITEQLSISRFGKVIFEGQYDRLNKKF